ncbi:T-box transcription factor TBX20-like [Saccostrea echinata]|uniref:T-box transcription factor TBX20-like n=1 Tax=Saccostrea echinata TaxID=191078 RepID=UPI002A824667|nr:T-box transcription factor TBX20-like [Saccostrea echinata]
MDCHNNTHQNSGEANAKQQILQNEGKKNSNERVSSNISSSPSSSFESSSSEMEMRSSDMDTCQLYSMSSGSSAYSDVQSLSTDDGVSRGDIAEKNDNCIQLTNGLITMSMTDAKLWYKFLKVGTEMIINRNGRRMFPYVEFYLRGLDPFGLYDVIFDIIPASNKSFKFLNNKWIPIARKKEDYKNHPFKHPDSPRIGSEWMTRKISFEKIKLSNKPSTKPGMFTLHTFQKYLVRISLVKREKDDGLSVVEFPIQATTFIAVTAYNNKDVTVMKINSNPHSKGFRFPVKRSPLDLSANKDSRQSNHDSDSEGSAANDKQIQTDVTMADMDFHFYLPTYSNPERHIERIRPCFCHIFGHFPRGLWEPARQTENEKKVLCTVDDREREKLEERRMEYNARIETDHFQREGDEVFIPQLFTLKEKLVFIPQAITFKEKVMRSFSHSRSSEADDDEIFIPQPITFMEKVMRLFV